MDMLPSTADRVAMSTAAATNPRIRHQSVRSTAMYADKEKSAIRERLADFDHGWDVKRAFEASAGLLTLAGFVLGLRRNRFWLLLSGLAGFFLLLHAMKGWYPPLPMIRQLGVRTAKEIETKQAALRQRRGNFASDQSSRRAELKENPGI